MHKLCMLSVLLLLICITATAQKKRVRWNPMTDTPTTITIDSFLPLLISENCYDDYLANPMSRTLISTIEEMGRDRNWIYFTHDTYRGIHTYKVSRLELGKVDFDSWNVCLLKKEFFYRAVPEKDPKRTPNFFCNTTPGWAEYTCRYIDSINAIEITLEWKIYCEILIKLVNEKYTGIYSFQNNSFLEGD